MSGGDCDIKYTNARVWTWGVGGMCQKIKYLASYSTAELYLIMLTQPSPQVHTCVLDVLDVNRFHLLML